MQQQLARLSLAASHKLSAGGPKKPRLDVGLRAADAPLNDRASIHTGRPPQQQQPPPPRPRAPIPAARTGQQAQQQQQPPVAVVPPYSGMFSHGYVFSGGSLPFRPPKRPIDALYYLNVLASGGQKTTQQRTTERIMTNALLNPDLIRALQGRAAQELGEEDLDFFDEHGMMKAPERLMRPGDAEKGRKFSRKDAESAIAKLARALEEIGFGDTALLA